VGDNCYKLSRN